MKIAVLAHPDGWHFQDLKRAAGNQHHVYSCRYQQLSTLISNAENLIQTGDHDLRDCDCLLVRAMPAGSLSQVVFRMDVLQQLQKGGVLIVNSPRTIEASVDKYLSLCYSRTREFRSRVQAFAKRRQMRFACLTNWEETWLPNRCLAAREKDCDG